MTQSFKTVLTISKKGPITMENLDFGTNLSKLKKLMQLKSPEIKQTLEADFNGVDGLVKKLCSHQTNGIPDSQKEIDRRIQAFGKNEIKPKKPKSFIALAFEAVQDATLIMLIICAVISIGLSFYHPELDELDEEFRQREQMGEKANLEWVEG